MTTCKHYNSSFHNTHCDAGVCYADVTPDWGNDLGRFFRQPCKLHDIAELQDGQAESYRQRGTCDRFEAYTEEEQKAMDAECEALIERTKKTIVLTQQVKKEHKGEDWQGVVECPECGGRLHVSHSAYNSHVWGQCETDGCYRWIE